MKRPLSLSLSLSVSVSLSLSLSLSLWSSFSISHLCFSLCSSFPSFCFCFSSFITQNHSLYNEVAGPLARQEGAPRLSGLEGAQSCFTNPSNVEDEEGTRRLSETQTGNHHDPTSVRQLLLMLLIQMMIARLLLLLVLPLFFLMNELLFLLV